MAKRLLSAGRHPPTNVKIRHSGRPFHGVAGAHRRFNPLTSRCPQVIVACCERVARSAVHHGNTERRTNWQHQFLLLPSDRPHDRRSTPVNGPVPNPRSCVVSLLPSVRHRLTGLCAGRSDRTVLLVVVVVFAAALLLAGYTPDAVIAFLTSLGLVTTAVADQLLPGRNTTSPGNVVLR
jgi:hypothetical protein